MKAKATLGLAVLMTGWGMASPAFGQTAPSFPSMEAVLEARAPLVRPDLQAKIAGFEAQLSGNSLFHALVTDRVEEASSLSTVG